MQADGSKSLWPKAAVTTFVPCLFWACWMILPSGCTFGRSGDYVKNISSVKPEVATQAMGQAAQNKSQRAIVPLVKRLYSEDPVIRLSAIRALKDITGQDLGYRYYEPEIKRIEAIERWEAWIVEQNLVTDQQQAEPSD